MIYDIMEFATSLKPCLLESLLDSGASEVLYLDPDIQVFGDLNRLAELAAEHGIVLTPHTTAPYPQMGRPTQRTPFCSRESTTWDSSGLDREQSLPPFLADATSSRMRQQPA